jgi:ketosteroid isomerase-like protein
MSQENVEVVLRHVEALRRRDVDALVALVSPGVEWEDAVFFTEPTHVYRGEAALRAWFRAVVEPWESIDAEVEEVIDAGDDRVLLGGVLTASGKASGVETQIRGWFVLWVTNGKITRRQVFRDRDHALEAAGLSE